MEGEISGISAGNIPFWFRVITAGGNCEIEELREKKLESVLLKKPFKMGHWSLKRYSFMIELMLQKVIEYHNLKNIHENLAQFKSIYLGVLPLGP